MPILPTLRVSIFVGCMIVLKNNEAILDNRRITWIISP